MDDAAAGFRSEWASLKDKWFKGETVDPVFEGVVRDFCLFDATMRNVHEKVTGFLKGVESMAIGMIALSEGVNKGLAHAHDTYIASDGCKLKEATNAVARVDAPHSAIAKLRRDMNFNVITPVQDHLANNRNLKLCLDIRRRRLAELTAAKKSYDDCVKKVASNHDQRFILARTTFEAAKSNFNEVDRNVFEWLYILEEYRGDILDSTLQTIKYLQYEFFASSAHAVSLALPMRMEFRPMVEMTPKHLEAQVEMELKRREEEGEDEGDEIANFATRLIDKKARDDPGEDAVQLPVDPLSLSSLLSQGFEEGPARQALRKHQNDTQAAMDYLLNGSNEMEEKQKLMLEGVRMPTSVKYVKRLRAMRKAQQEKREADRAADEAKSQDSDDHATAGAKSKDAKADSTAAPAPKEPAKPQEPVDLLSLDEEQARPTDFSTEVQKAPLPPQISFDTSRCEVAPLPAAVAAGLSNTRGADLAAGAVLDLMGSSEPAQTASAATAPSSAQVVDLDPFGDPRASGSGGKLQSLVDLEATHSAGTSGYPMNVSSDGKGAKAQSPGFDLSALVANGDLL
eukprot:TRINITY_DN28021_c0_g2_i1.p1 TRINITY_DN28021_c0_g2~~TRINITY_DN28021_c0_g2_i1.p1  ORF type:complete len:569 (-),score=129.02 TRINITY_DN28021_c0_g2_i1:178-1884(-)